MAPSAQQAFDQAGRGDTVIGWKLDRDQRKELLQQFPPRYGSVVADHVTLRTRSARRAALPSESLGEIVGRRRRGRRGDGGLARRHYRPARRQHLWEEMGGVFIHHRNVDETLERLRADFAIPA
jgi:hypothetical protein